MAAINLYQMAKAKESEWKPVLSLAKWQEYLTQQAVEIFGIDPAEFGDVGQMTIIAGRGMGKSRYMEGLFRQFGPQATRQANFEIRDDEK